ncbi:MAG: hypothetical protein ACOC3J_07125 [Gemmatimonadota bacterium]
MSAGKDRIVSGDKGDRSTKPAADPNLDTESSRIPEEPAREGTSRDAGSRSGGDRTHREGESSAKPAAEPEEREER